MAEGNRRFSATVAPPDKSGFVPETFWAVDDDEAAKLATVWAEAVCRKKGWLKASITLVDDKSVGIGMPPVDFTTF